MRKSSKLLVLNGMVLCIGIGAFVASQSTREPISEQRVRDGYQYVSTTRDPLVSDLFRGEIVLGTPVESIVPRIGPHEIDHVGPYTIYEFSDNNYDWKTLIARDNHVAYASVGSCTFHWTFFDSVRDDAHNAIARVFSLRRSIAKLPESESEIRIKLESILQRQLTELDEL